MQREFKRNLFATSHIVHIRMDIDIVMKDMCHCMIAWLSIINSFTLIFFLDELEHMVETWPVTSVHFITLIILHCHYSAKIRGKWTMLLNPLMRKNARCSCAKVITKNYDINWKKYKSFSNIICGVFNLIWYFE